MSEPYVKSAVLVAFLVVATDHTAQAATKSWKNSVGSGDWSVGANWETDSGPANAPPAAGDNVFIAPTDGVARTINYNVSAPPLFGLAIDLTGPGENRTTFQMSSGTLTNVGFIVGEFGRATVNQSGGSFIHNDPAYDGAVGYRTGGNGIYNLSGAAALSLAKDFYIGGQATSSGTFNQTGGAVAIARDLLLATDNNSSGTYTLSGGALTVGRDVRLSIGSFSFGRLNVAGGILTAGKIAISSSGSGVHLTGGTINVGSLDVKSQLFLTGGMLNVTGAGGLVIGADIGNITLGPQQTLKVTQLTNIGPPARLTLNGGTLVTSDVFRGGLFEFNSGTLHITKPGGITIGQFGTGALFPARLTLGSSQTLRVDAATTLYPGHALTLSGGTLDTATVTFQGGGQFNWNSGRLSVGTYVGSLVNPGGVFAPGHSAGGADILGNYEQQSAAALEIEIGGTAAATQFDFVNVSGAAQIGGQLRLSLIDGFTPASQHQFKILDADSLTGSFSNAGNGQRVATVDGLGSFVVHYGPASPFDPTQIILTAFQPVPVSGDFDLDGDVDGADFLRWQRGQSPRPHSAADLAEWKAHFYSVVAAGSAAPEPAAVSMIAVGVLAVACQRRLVGRPSSPGRRRP